MGSDEILKAELEQAVAECARLQADLIDPKGDSNTTSNNDSQGLQF